MDKRKLEILAQVIPYAASQVIPKYQSLNISNPLMEALSQDILSEVRSALEDHNVEFWTSYNYKTKDLIFYSDKDRTQEIVTLTLQINYAKVN